MEEVLVAVMTQSRFSPWRVAKGKGAIRSEPGGNLFTSAEKAPRNAQLPSFCATIIPSSHCHQKMLFIFRMVCP